MVKKSKYNRVSFPKGEQKQFIERLRRRFSIQEIARSCHCSERTIRDWQRERFLMDLSCMRLLCKRAHYNVPKNIQLKDQYWYVLKGASVGGKLLMKKYGRVGGDPEYRQKQWRKWWDREGKFKPHPIINVPKNIREPDKSEKLAEFIGIMLGDGGITPNQVIITLNRKSDRQYSFFVRRLMRDLFGTTPRMYHVVKDTIVNIVVSRVKLVRFCTEKLGLVIGNKVRQQIDIPAWIRDRREYEIACVRGLVDTDGSIFTHRYQVKGKWYRYKKLCFSSRSRPLLQSVHTILEDLGLHPRLTDGLDVRLDRIQDMKKYFETIGSHNPKHVRRYLQ